ncbi:putative RNA-directed DNA polymerase, eukaryota, reverse transcriptase zinc-binding domain protein [Tanacetum coccineum]
MLTLQDLKKSRKLSLQSFRTSESMSSSNVKVMKSRRRKITKAFRITTNMSMSDHSSANGKMKKRSHIIQEIRDQDQVIKTSNSSSRDQDQVIKTKKKQKKVTPAATLSANATTVVTKTLLDDVQNGFKKGNFVSSPLSLDIVLGMLMSSSSKLIAQSLSKRNSGLEFSLVNSVWVDKKDGPVLSSYQKVIENVYKTEAKYVDFKDTVKLKEASKKLIHGKLDNLCWINSFLDSSYASVLINGSPTKEFKIEKGLRQGDPLSPFLFILAVEALNVVFLEARNKRIFLGVEVGIDKVPISHLQFADDALIIGQWTLANAKNLSRILTCFHLASGLKMNFNKSKLFGIGVSNYDLNSVASSIGCQPSHLPCIYLGIPIGANMSRLSNWSPLVERFQKRLSNWKSKSLSYGGRLTLLKSILGNLGVYFFSTFKAPTTIIKKLEIGNGQATRFWLDPWIGGPLLCDSFPRLFRLESNSECMMIDQAPRPTPIVVTQTLINDAQNKFKNGLVCSPLSIEIILGMLAAGAEGETLKQLLEFLRHESINQLHSESSSSKLLANILSKPKSDIDVSLANGVWVDKKVEPIRACYRKALKSVYKTKAKYMDLENKVSISLHSNSQMSNFSAKCSIMTQEMVDSFCESFYIPAEVHPTAPGRDKTIAQFPANIGLLDFIKTADPRKVRAVEVQKGDDQVTLLESTRHCFMPLVIPAAGGSSSVTVTEIPASTERGKEDVAEENAYLELADPDEGTDMVSSSTLSAPVDTVATTTTSTKAKLAADVNPVLAGPSQLEESEGSDDSFYELATFDPSEAKRWSRTEHELELKEKLNAKYAARGKLLEEKDLEILRLKSQLAEKEAEAAEVTITQKDNDISLLDSRATHLASSLDDAKAACAEAGTKITSLASERDRLASEDFKEKMEVQQEEQAQELYNCVAELEAHVMDKEVASDPWDTTCSPLVLKSSEYQGILGHALGLAIDFGMQEGLEAGHEHGVAGRSLSLVDVYNPKVASTDYVNAVKALEDAHFRLVDLLKSKKDAGMDEVLDCFLLDGPLSELPEAASLQLCIEQLSIPIHHAGDKTAVEETSLSFALMNVHARAEGAKKHAAALR